MIEQEEGNTYTTTPRSFLKFLKQTSLGALSHILSDLDQTKQPAVCAALCIGVAMQDKVKAEVDHMQSLGVTTPVTEPTDWVSSIVATYSENSKKYRPVLIC